MAPTGDGEIDLAAKVTPLGLRREIFGFLPYWELSDSSTTLDFKKLSTIAYFGVGAAANGNLEKTNSDGSTTVGWSGWTSSKMTTLINQAHAANTRVVLTVQSFAWSTGGADKQQALLGSSANRANLARQIAKAVGDRGADGVNLDFEPLSSGYDEEFTALVRSVRYELNKLSTGHQITFDTTGWIGNYPLEDATAPGGADAIFIMGYDYRSAGSSNAGLHRAAEQQRLRHHRHPQRLPRSRAGVQAHPGRALLRPRLVDRVRPAPCHQHQRHQERGLGGGHLLVGHHPAPGEGPSLRRRRGRGLDRLSTRELHHHLRLRHALAPAVPGRRDRAQGQVRPRQPHAGCGAPASGPSATTTTGPSCGAPSRPSS